VVSHVHAAAQIRTVECGVVELLKGFLFVLDYEDGFVFKHLVRQLQTLDALELRVNGFALHARVVAENALVHVLLRQLEAVLVRDLAADDAAGRLRVPEVVHAEEFQNLELLPDCFLLREQILLQQFNFGWSLITYFLLLLHVVLLVAAVLADEGDRVRHVVGLAHALPRVLDFANHHVDPVLLVMTALLRVFRRSVVTSITFQFLMQIIHSL
jgi:hypothetical protein